MFASRNRKSDIVILLIEKGADVNTWDNSGKKVLMYAVEDGHDDIIQLLCEQK